MGDQNEEALAVQQPSAAENSQPKESSGPPITRPEDILGDLESPEFVAAEPVGEVAVPAAWNQQPEPEATVPAEVAIPDPVRAPEQAQTYAPMPNPAMVPDPLAASTPTGESPVSKSRGGKSELPKYKKPHGPMSMATKVAIGAVVTILLAGGAAAGIFAYRNYLAQKDTEAIVSALKKLEGDSGYQVSGTLKLGSDSYSGKLVVGENKNSKLTTELSSGPFTALYLKSADALFLHLPWSLSSEKSYYKYSKYSEAESKFSSKYFDIKNLLKFSSLANASGIGNFKKVGEEAVAGAKCRKFSYRPSSGYVSGVSDQLSSGDKTKLVSVSGTTLSGYIWVSEGENRIVKVTVSGDLKAKSKSAITETKIGNFSVTESYSATLEFVYGSSETVKFPIGGKAITTQTLLEALGI